MLLVLTCTCARARPPPCAVTSNGPVLVKSNVTSNGKMTANQGFVTAASLIARQCACANYPAAPFQGQSS